jgi:hypothetical protein
MKNLAIVAVVFWLLFANGFSTLRGLLSRAEQAGAPQIIVNGAQRVVQTVQPAAVSTPQPTTTPQPRAGVIVPARMPFLPTATAAPVEPSAPAEVVAVAAPVVDAQATADAEARIAAWLAAPPSQPTVTPIPTEYVPAFKAEFQPQPECSPFVGYIGADKARCDAFFATQTAVATQD